MCSAVQDAVQGAACGIVHGVVPAVVLDGFRYMSCYAGVPPTTSPMLRGAAPAPKEGPRKSAGRGVMVDGMARGWIGAAITINVAPAIRLFIK